MEAENNKLNQSQTAVWTRVHIQPHSSLFVLCPSCREVEHRQKHRSLAEVERKSFSCCSWKLMLFLCFLSLTTNRWGRWSFGSSSVSFWISWAELSACLWSLLVCFEARIGRWCIISQTGCIILHWPKTKITRLRSRGLKAERGEEGETMGTNNIMQSTLFFLYYLCFCCSLVSWIIQSHWGCLLFSAAVKKTNSKLISESSELWSLVILLWTHIYI